MVVITDLSESPQVNLDYDHTNDNENNVNMLCIDLKDDIYETDSDESGNYITSDSGSASDSEDEETENMETDSDESGNDSTSDTGSASDSEYEEAEEMETNGDEGNIPNGAEATENNSRISGADIVKDVLARESEAEKAISVIKPLDLEYDLGTLLAVDTNDLNDDLLRNSKEEYLKNLARDNTQLLINKIWQLPLTREKTEIVAKLPAPTCKVPRGKIIPKPKLPTKWEKFALEKGIRKTKRGKVQWDETLKKWVPWWGYRRAQAEKEKNWVIEVRKNDDPNEDPYAKKKAQKQERVAKNEYQRLKNVAVANNVKVPRFIEAPKKVSISSALNKNKNNITSTIQNPKVSKSFKKKGENPPRVGLLTADRMASTELKKAITIAKLSTRSLGNFQSKLPKEKEAKNIKPILPIARKKKHEFLKVDKEKSVYLNTIDKILNKKPKLDLEKAVNRHIHQEQVQRAEEKKTEKPKGRGKKRKAGGKGKAKGRGQGKVRMGDKSGKQKNIGKRGKRK